MAPIKNAAEVLRLAMPTATTLQVAGIIERQIDAMTRLVDELLLSMQSKHDALVLRPVNTAVHTIVERSIEMIEPLLRARQQALSIRMPPQPIYIEADEIWLTQAVQNVLGNAVKYTDGGGRIAISVERDGPDVEISVHDTGVGLTLAETETVFGLYAQVVQPATRASVGGLGVGLHVAQVVVNAHGGSIRAASEGPGRGSTFLIRLPCRAPATASRLG